MFLGSGLLLAVYDIRGFFVFEKDNNTLNKSSKQPTTRPLLEDLFIRPQQNYYELCSFAISHLLRGDLLYFIHYHDCFFLRLLEKTCCFPLIVFTYSNSAHYVLWRDIYLTENANIIFSERIKIECLYYLKSKWVLSFCVTITDNAGRSGVWLGGKSQLFYNFIKYNINVHKNVKICQKHYLANIV